ncbi:MAG: GGDEF domain-containing protein [Desulfovibrionaceae bacterium]|nr:GGDEF domain-containing protein [Desulfovibrionaceae bacterium]MBF0514379.1 GGDEF domain-containing protein [Desulfovibrionaceae bacterium]
MSVSDGHVRIAWGIDLPPETESRVLEALGPGHALINKPSGQLDAQTGGEPPELIFAPLSVWENLRGDGLALAESFGASERVLLLDKTASPESVEEIVSKGFLTAIPSGAGAEKIRAALAKARDSVSVYEEISRLVGSVITERKTLTEQRDRLAFLHHLLARASSSMDAERILTGLLDDVSGQYPVSELLAAFWRGDSGVAAEIFLSQGLSGAEESARTKYLLHLAAKALGGVPADYLVARVKGLSNTLSPAPTAPGKSLLIDFETSGLAFGCLAVVTHAEISSENRGFLRAAIRQLGPAFRNALAYRGLKYRADRDGLTRLPNRRAFDERLAQEVDRQGRYGGQLSFLLLDIDHFKQINDTYGHQAGDETLRELGAIILQTVRGSDFAARYGGEEFAVILPGTDAAQAWLLAERLRSRTAGHHFEHESRPIKVTLSVGAASSQAQKPLAAEELVRQADTAMYAAKSGGRNAVVAYDGEQTRRASGLAAQAG